MNFIYLFFSSIRHIKTYFNVKVFQKRHFVFNKTGKCFKVIKNHEKLLVVIAHVVPDGANATPEKLERICACLDALGKSLDAIESTIVLLTKDGYSLFEQLPVYWKERIKEFNSMQEDPMFVEYDAYDVFQRYFKEHDYFLFLEDDILLTDSWFLEKIKRFNHYSPNINYVLTPHRYEYSKSIKHYFDQAIVKNEASSYTYSDKFKINFADVSFTIFQNPHCAFYCLSKEQIALWINSGYQWRNKVVAFGILESAATFSLYENFEFFKPHPSCMGYFEVQHYGNKYMLKHNVIQPKT